MSIIDKALNAIGLTKKANADIPLSSGVSQSGFGLFNLSGTKISAAKAMGAYNAWTYACVRAIAEELAKTHFKLYKVKKDKDKNIYEEISEHPILDLLDGVNPYQTGYELKYLTGSHLELTGNSYWLLDGVTDEKSQPKALYILNPKYIKVIPAPLPEFIKGYSYIVDGVEKTYKPYEILHHKYPDPNNPYEGIGTVQAIAEWIDADNAATTMNGKYFTNGARLGGIITAETAITDGQMKVMRSSFESLYKGKNNAYQVGILPKGAKYEETSATPKDMDFSTLQQVMRDKILGAFRVPKTILGTAESETNRATAETANYIFSERTIKPKLEQIVQYLNEFLVPRYGDDLVLDFESPTPADRVALMAELTAALGTGQASMSVNEARAQFFDLPPISNGDEVMTSFNSVPLGAPEKKENTSISSKGTTKRPSVRYAKNAKARKSMATDIAERIAKGIDDIQTKEKEIKETSLNKIKSLTKEDYSVMYKAFFNRVTPYEKLIATAVRKMNKDQKEEVLKNLGDNSKANIKSPVLDTAKYVSVLIDLVTPIFTDLFSKEADSAAKFIGTTFTLSKPVQDAIKRSAELMSQSYNETTVADITAVISQAQLEGASLDQVSDRISQIYEVADGMRADRVARTETFRVGNDATKEAWKQSEVVKTIKWYTAEDEAVCPYCGPEDGKVIDIESDFYSKGDTVVGSDGQELAIDYSDVGAPPLHVNCRCYIRPEDISTD